MTDYYWNIINKLKNKWIVEKIYELEKMQYHGSITFNFNNGDCPNFEAKMRGLKGTEVKQIGTESDKPIEEIA